MITNVVRTGLLSMQICVPKEYTDEQVLKDAETLNPCGTDYGWHIRKQGSELLGGCNERVVCSQYPENVHIMLGA